MISFLIAGVAFFMTLYQQNVHGFSAVRTGLALLPMVDHDDGPLADRRRADQQDGSAQADLVRHDRDRHRRALLLLAAGVDASYWTSCRPSS